jgi:hypothetical protein
MKTFYVNNPLPPWNRTLLHSAVSACDVELTWDLLNSGANPFVKDYLGVSPSSLAASMMSVQNSTHSRTSTNISKIYDILPKFNEHSSVEVIPPLARGRTDHYSPNSELSMMAQPNSTSRSVSENVHALNPLATRIFDKFRRLKVSQRVKSAVDAGIVANIEISAVPSDAITQTTKLLVDQGMQQFTHLTLVRITSDNNSIHQSEYEDETKNIDTEPNKDIGDADITLSALRNWSVQEMITAIVHDPHCDSNHYDTSNKSRSDLLKFQCDACMEEMNLDQLAYTCHKLGCCGCLCQDCLFHLVRVTITSALYAVPIVRCPGKCMSRIPTAVWFNAIRNVEATADLQQSIQVVDGDALEAKCHAIGFQVKRSMLEFKRINFHDGKDISSNDDENMSVSIYELYCLYYNILDGLSELCELHEMSLVYLLDDLISDIVSENVGIVDGKDVLFSSVKIIADKGKSTNYSLNERSIIDIMYYRREFDDDELTSISKVCNQSRTFVIPMLEFLYQHYPNLLLKLSHDLYTNRYRIKNSNGELLYKIYESNANALLKMRCGSCHESVGLFYNIENNHFVIKNFDQRKMILENLLNDMDEKEKLSFLQCWIGYCAGKFSAQVFVENLLNVCFASENADFDEAKSNGLLDRSVMDVIRNALLLLNDIERRFTAQLCIFRQFPKILTPCCNEAHCFMCKVYGHHEGSTCEEIQSQEIGIEAQYCPGCGVPTLRTEGCNHIICVCGYSWYWRDENEYNY